MKRKLRIKFTDFWPTFNKRENYFVHLLSKVYDIEFSDDPEILLYSHFGFDHRNYKCVRVLFLGENIRPDFRECDFAFCFDYLPDNPRNYRLPLYAMYDDVKRLTLPKDPVKIASLKTKFCAFVVSNKFSSKRIDFFKKLSKYKMVDSGGMILNNVGGPVENKIAFLKDYKFTISFENSSYPGYTSEKVFEPMLVDSLPIYWGNPLVDKDLNTKSFINCHEYQNDDEVIERIIEVDNNRDKYLEILTQPYFSNNEVNEFVSEENVLKQFAFIVDSLPHIKTVATLYKPRPKIFRIMEEKSANIASRIKLFLR